MTGDTRTFQPGEFRVCEVGEIKLMDGSTIKGAIIEFPAGPPDGFSWADVWTGKAFKMARVVEIKE
jgi:hypothetical protein